MNRQESTQANIREGQHSLSHADRPAVREVIANHRFAVKEPADVEARSAEGGRPKHTPIKFELRPAAGQNISQTLPPPKVEVVKERTVIPLALAVKAEAERNAQRNLFSQQPLPLPPPQQSQGRGGASEGSRNKESAEEPNPQARATRTVRTTDRRSDRRDADSSERDGQKRGPIPDELPSRTLPSPPEAPPPQGIDRQGTSRQTRDRAASDRQPDRRGHDRRATDRQGPDARSDRIHKHSAFVVEESSRERSLSTHPASDVAARSDGHADRHSDRQPDRQTDRHPGMHESKGRSRERGSREMRQERVVHGSMERRGGGEQIPAESAHASTHGRSQERYVSNLDGTRQQPQDSAANRQVLFHGPLIGPNNLPLFSGNRGPYHCPLHAYKSHNISLNQ